jgi:menaquinone-dependent protoporphyrinogen oxidase
MNTVLVVYASQMGSTAEIAAVVGDQLTRRGFHVDVQSTAAARDARLYDAVIVGSPVYFGRWDRTALRFLQAQAPDLAERPTWLFQSGPCGPGASTEPARTPRAVERFCAAVGIAAPVTFGGNLDRSKARTWLARRVATGNLAGDSRDWHAIRAWADGVSDHLESVVTLTAV